MEVGHLPPSRRSHRAERRSRSTLKIISAKLCFRFYTTSVKMCIFIHNLCEGWRRCTTLRWVETRSWSPCCWRPRRQWILKTIKVKYTQISSCPNSSLCSKTKAKHTRLARKQNNHKKHIFPAFPAWPITSLYVIKYELVGNKITSV